MRFCLLNVCVSLLLLLACGDSAVCSAVRLTLPPRPLGLCSAVDATDSRKHSSRNAFGQPDGLRSEGAAPIPRCPGQTGSQGPAAGPRRPGRDAEAAEETARRHPSRRCRREGGGGSAHGGAGRDADAAAAGERLAARHRGDGRRGAGDSDEGARRARWRCAPSGGRGGRGGCGGEGRACAARVGRGGRRRGAWAG